MKLSGIPASPGIGVGPVVLVLGEDFAVREFPIAPDRAEEEVAYFQQALDASRRDLEQIRNGIAAELGEAEAAIYDAHLMILDDPDLKRAVHEGIRQHRRNAGIVFRDYMSAIATRLERVEDEYLRERRADILDVERRVLRYLVGGGQRALANLKEPSILVAHEIGPSDVAMLDRTRVLGFITETGGREANMANAPAQRAGAGSRRWSASRAPPRACATAISRPWTASAARSSSAPTSRRSPSTASVAPGSTRRRTSSTACAIGPR